LAYEERRTSVQLVSKISNLPSPDPPTSQTDRRTDDMRSQDRALHYNNNNNNTIIYKAP